MLPIRKAAQLTSCIAFDSLWWLCGLIAHCVLRLPLTVFFCFYLFFFFFCFISSLNPLSASAATSSLLISNARFLSDPLFRWIYRHEGWVCLYSLLPLFFFCSFSLLFFSFVQFFMPFSLLLLLSGFICCYLFSVSSLPFVEEKRERETSLKLVPTPLDAVDAV